MVGKNRQNSQLINKVAEVYDWLNSQIKDHENSAGRCCACGKCCDFESFGHKLFVTSPEMIYLTEKLGAENIKSMKKGICPYSLDDKCTIYEFRFAGCRIFSCKGDADFQSRLSEEVSKKFKAICEQFLIPYRYSDLATALNELVVD
ncbi:MAG: hypothetical protein PHY02_11100 [Phycisphaerae bacterium]|nr:hypothetical protein [Phycisphaerae bacterium]